MFSCCWSSTFNLVKKIVSISYLVSFLSQFKNERTPRAFQTYFIILFPKSQERIASIQEVTCRTWEWSLEKKAASKLVCQILYSTGKYWTIELSNWIYWDLFVRLYLVFVSIKESCTLNFYQETKRLIQMCTFNNSPNWAIQFKKSDQNWQIVRMLFSSMIMQSPTHLWSLAKNYWN